MGGKKKPGEDGDDIIVEQFWKMYKKNIAALETTVCKAVKQAYDEYLEDGEHITKFHIWDPIGWQGVGAIMSALRTVNYPHTRSIRFWKTHCEDEGVRAVCLYIN